MSIWHPHTSLPAGTWRPSPAAPNQSGRKIWLSPFDNIKCWPRLFGWHREYLLQLRNYHKIRRPARQGPKFKVGDIVLLQEERMPRHMWKKARIDELLRGRDGQIRTVSLRLQDRSKISRPVQLVIPLEIDQCGKVVKDWDIFPFISLMNDPWFSFYFVPNVYSL